MSWFLAHFWRTVLLDKGFLVNSFFVLVFWMHQSSAFWPPKFLMKNLLIILLGIPCRWWITSHLLLSKFSVFGFWQFDYNVSWCESLWVHLTWSFLMFIFMCFIAFGKFSAIISSNILPSPFFSSPYGSPTMCIFVHLMVSHRFLRLCSLF